MVNVVLDLTTFQDLQNIPGLQSQVKSHQYLILYSNSYHFLLGPTEHTWLAVTGDVSAAIFC